MKKEKEPKFYCLAYLLKDGDVEGDYDFRTLSYSEVYKRGLAKMKKNKKVWATLIVSNKQTAIVIKRKWAESDLIKRANLK